VDKNVPQRVTTVLRMYAAVDAKFEHCSEWKNVVVGKAGG
jgi:hypothetical protein